MGKWPSRWALIVIACQPLMTAAILELVDEAVSRGTIIASVACSVIQAVLLLWIQSGAEKTDDIARAAHIELRDASEIDYAAIIDSELNSDSSPRP
jgi:hypothetical protein